MKLAPGHAMLPLCVFFFLAAVFSPAIEIESVDSLAVIDRLLHMREPGAPEILDDYVIFTAPSSVRRVGIAFADEGFSKVHWFRQLLVDRGPDDPPSTEKRPSPTKDSGIAFYIHEIPQGTTEIEYRLIINGLWTTDPANPNVRQDRTSGLSWSIVPLPPKEIIPHPLSGPPGSLNFVFKGPPGEIVSVAGSFNGWDPFMYELREGPSGTYSINIPLPPGRYQYVFFHKGQRFLDPYNSVRIYSRDGKIANEIVIQ